MKKSSYAWLVVPLAAPVGALAVYGALRSPPHQAVAYAADNKPTQPQQVQRVSPEANEALKRMTDYLAGLKSFKVENATTDEIVTTSGQKIQYATDSRVSVVRPNHLRSEQIVSPNSLMFVYDGKSMTLYCKADNTYSTAPAPPTLDATIDMVRSKYDADTPGADLLFSHPYDILMEQVKSGLVVGPEVIEGTLTNHLAFEGDTVDWQIWIKEGAEPLPMRFVITTKDLPNRPQFTVELTNWQPQAVIDESQFQFTPPPNAKKVDKMPTDCGGKPHH